nr:acyl-CoA dehydrogenase family protein [Pseudovibrio sp. POLY-S9]
MLRKFLSDKCSSHHLRDELKTQIAFNLGRWQELGALGMYEALISEANDGLALRATDFCLMAQLCGYALLPEPLVEQAGVVLPLLERSGDDDALRLLKAVVAMPAPIALVHPNMPFCLGPDEPYALLRSRGDDMVLMQPHEFDLRKQPSIDPLRPVYTLAPGHAGGKVIASGALGRSLINWSGKQGALLCAAQLIGIAQACLDLAVEYSKTRQQFGRAIGSYQALKHQMANTKVQIERDQPMLYAAAARVEEDTLSSQALVSQIYLNASQTAVGAARCALQVHGAMGYSWEVDVHLYLKRALMLSQQWACPQDHSDHVAAAVLNGALVQDTLFAAPSPQTVLAYA